MFTRQQPHGNTTQMARFLVSLPLISTLCSLRLKKIANFLLRHNSFQLREHCEEKSERATPRNSLKFWTTKHLRKKLLRIFFTLELIRIQVHSSRLGRFSQLVITLLKLTEVGKCLPECWSKRKDLLLTINRLKNRLFSIMYTVDSEAMSARWIIILVKSN